MVIVRAGEEVEVERRPLWSPWSVVVLVIALDVAFLISTAVGQAPPHAKLDREGFSAGVIRTLVRSNWIRTALWTINALLLLGMVAMALLAARWLQVSTQTQ